jgi:hypothetical protein
MYWVPGAVSPGLKRQRRESDHSSPSSANIKNDRTTILALTLTSSWRAIILSLTLFRSLRLLIHEKLPTFFFFFELENSLLCCQEPIPSQTHPVCANKLLSFGCSLVRSTLLSKSLPQVGSLCVGCSTEPCIYFLALQHMLRPQPQPSHPSELERTNMLIDYSLSALTVLSMLHINVKHTNTFNSSALQLVTPLHRHTTKHALFL